MARPKWVWEHYGEPNVSLEDRAHPLWMKEASNYSPLDYNLYCSHTTPSPSPSLSKQLCPGGRLPVQELVTS